MRELYMTVKEAAAELQLTPSRIRQLLGTGQLSGEKIGRDWWVLRSDVERLRREKG